MIARSLLALTACLCLASLPVVAETFDEAPSANSSSADGSAAARNAANGLVETLGQRLNISDEQAIGGVGALLGLAMNRLEPADSAQLQQRLPGLGQLSSGTLDGGLGGLGGLAGLIGGAGQLLGGIQNLQDVDQVFNVLGMNQGMVGQFAGVMLDYMVQQGLNSQLLGTLGQIWGSLPSVPKTPLAPAPLAAPSGKAA
ncbi:DUF2780 domain-containing protein [Pseudomonas knackmussii]|uniref:DUF2780 domain-containing protein n=1 Tax=Pseudomonas knackmussii TaxID=65741 RepID=UPI003F4A10D1